MTDASLGIAGLDSIRIYNQARLGVAGVNTRPLADAAHLGIASQMSSWTRQNVVGKISKDAHLGIAGNFSTTLRHGVAEMLHQETERHARPEGNYRVVDQMRTWDRTIYTLCHHYLICTDPVLGYRWREGFRDLFGPENRIMPLALDNAAYPRWVYQQRKAQGRPYDLPEWAMREEAFWAACELTQPDLIFGWDEIGDVQASVEGYKRFRSVYGDRVIPVWQAPAMWDPTKDLRIPGSQSLKPDERAVIANANWAARHDPVLRWMCEQAKIVGIGGMVRGPLPPGVRHLYIAELARCFPDNQFWALGMARDTVVNGLGQLGLLDRIWLDGSWWIHNARNDRLPYVEDGLIRNLDLGAKSAEARKRGAKGMSAYSFATLSELMVMHLRCLKAGYQGQIQFPKPLPLPIDPRDLDQMKEIKQLMLWDVLPETGTEG